MRYTLLLTLLLPTLALAQASSTSVIPYSGTLFSQGKPVSQDSDVLMAFALYSGDAMTALPAGSTNEAPDVALAEENPSYNRLWTSWMTEDGTVSQLSSLTGENPDTIGVKVRNGRFLVHLGASGQTALPDSVFDQRPLYVVTWVVNASGVFRLPPQALDKVPHAITAERANSFEVMGDLRVEGDLQVIGDVNLTGQITSPISSRVRQPGELILRYASTVLSREAPVNANNYFATVGNFGYKRTGVVPAPMPTMTRKTRLVISWADNIAGSGCYTNWRIIRGGAQIMSWNLTNTWAGGNISNYDITPWNSELLGCFTSNANTCRVEVRSPTTTSCNGYTFSKINITIQVYDQVN